jgi:hypothetical protein
MCCAVISSPERKILRECYDIFSCVPGEIANSGECGVNDILNNLYHKRPLVNNIKEHLDFCGDGLSACARDHKQFKSTKLYSNFIT